MYLNIKQQSSTKQNCNKFCTNVAALAKKESYDKPRQCIKNQNHYFADKVLCRKCSIDICSLTSPTFTEQQRLPGGGGLWGKVFEGV